MKRFAFRVSDEDRPYVTQLELDGAHITLNLDTTVGGILRVREDASPTWSWLAEIACGDDYGADVEEGDLRVYPYVGLAVLIAPVLTSPSH